MGDRSGHRPWAPALALLLALAAPAAAADYKAQRFDVNAAIDGGNLDVRETITFEFLSGVRSSVSRDIASAGTDGVEVLTASMDGHPLTPGDAPGHFTIAGANRVRVEWHFPTTGPSRHSFELHYLIRGIVYRERGNDVLRWRALPAEHAYAIDRSRVTIVAPVRPVAGAKVEGHRLSIESSSDTGPGGVDIQAGDISSNGSLTAELRFAAGSLIAAPPRWQMHQMDTASLAPRWSLAAVAAFAIGLLAVFAARQGYPSPASRVAETPTMDPPSPLPPGLAATLASNGRQPQELGAATLMDLADRGALSVTQAGRRLGVRTFEIAQVPGKHDLADYELTALTIAFGGHGEPVSLTRARHRLGRGRRRLSEAVTADLAARGLLDPERKAARDRVSAVAFTLLFITAVSAVAGAVFVPTYGGWVFLISLGLAIATVCAAITVASTTPLSDDALVEAAAWRGYRRHLKAIAAGREPADAVPSRAIVYGVALGLASAWSRYVRKHPAAVPAWFEAAADDGSAFAAFVAINGANGGHGAGAGAA